MLISLGTGTHGLTHNEHSAASPLTYPTHSTCSLARFFSIPITIGLFHSLPHLFAPIRRCVCVCVCLSHTGHIHNLCARIYLNAWLFIDSFPEISRGMLNYAYVPWKQKKQSNERTGEKKKIILYSSRHNIVEERARKPTARRLIRKRKALGKLRGFPSNSLHGGWMVVSMVALLRFHTPNEKNHFLPSLSTDIKQRKNSVRMERK